MITCIYIHRTYINTYSLSAVLWQNTDVTHWNTILQSHQCLPHHSAAKAEGKIQRNTVSHKGVGEPWAHSAKGTSSFVHEVSNPVGQNRIQQMRCKRTFLWFFLFWCWNVTKEFLSFTSPLTLCCLFGLVPLQIRVGGDITDVQLVKLFPNTAYTLSLFALHGELASDPLTKQGVTCMYSLNYEVCLCTASYYCDLIRWPSVPFSVPLPPAGELRIRDVTHSSMVLNWDAAPGAVRKYHVTYKPEDGEVKEVCLVTLRFSIVLFLHTVSTLRLLSVWDIRFDAN